MSSGSGHRLSHRVAWNIGVESDRDTAMGRSSTDAGGCMVSSGVASELIACRNSAKGGEDTVCVGVCVWLALWVCDLVCVCEAVTDCDDVMVWVTVCVCEAVTDCDDVAL